MSGMKHCIKCNQPLSDRIINPYCYQCDPEHQRWLMTPEILEPHPNRDGPMVSHHVFLEEAEV